MIKIALSLCITMIVCYSSVAQTSDTLKVMSYNLLSFPNPGNNDPIGNDAARVSYFTDIINEVDPDIIICQEMTDISGATMLVDDLNANATTGKTYAHAPEFFEYGPTPWEIGNMLIYSNDFINLIEQSELPRNNSAVAPDGNTVIAPRAASLYKLDIVSDDCNTMTNQLEMISSHFKAGTGGASGNEIADNHRRDLSAWDIMDYVNTLPATTNVIAGGDFNLYSSSSSGSNAEPSYFTLTDNSNPFVDVFGGFVRNDPAEVHKYTQSTRAGNSFSEYGNGGAPGGIDDRFDFLLHSGSIENSTNKIQMIASSYHTIANPMSWNGDATDGSSPIMNQIRYMSDHYPVVMDIVSNYPNCSLCQSIMDIVDNYVSGENLTVEAETTISANNVIDGGSNIGYSAGECVELNAGFETTTNANFEAFIQGCSSN